MTNPSPQKTALAWSGESKPPAGTPGAATPGAGGGTQVEFIKLMIIIWVMIIVNIMIIMSNMKITQLLDHHHYQYQPHYHNHDHQQAGPGPLDVCDGGAHEPRVVAAPGLHVAQRHRPEDVPH